MPLLLLFIPYILYSVDHILPHVQCMLHMLSVRSQSFQTFDELFHPLFRNRSHHLAKDKRWPKTQLTHSEDQYMLDLRKSRPKH